MNGDRAPITVITASIPGREELLGATLASVYNQQIPVEAHLVMAKTITSGMPGPQHCAIQQGYLLPAVRSEFTMRLADDDQLLPHYVATMLPYLDQADVLYAWDANGSRPRVNCNDWGHDRVTATLETSNWIDGSAVLMRTEILRSFGGWPTEWEGAGLFQGGHFKGYQSGYDDQTVFYCMAKAGARFLCVPEETWAYGTGPWSRLSTGG